MQEAFQFWQEGSEPMPEYAWSNLTPKELHRQAIRMKGSAGGADGITGSEAAQLPLRAWEILAELLTRWIARQDFPSVWQHTRQVQNYAHKIRPYLRRICDRYPSSALFGE